MMASPTSRGQVGDSFASRRGHTNQLSISDPSHHVTEAIGTLYGDEDDNLSDHGRPLSFINAPQEQIQTIPGKNLHPTEAQRPYLGRSASDQPQPSPSQYTEHGSLRKSNTLSVNSAVQKRTSTSEMPPSPRSPTISLRDVQAEATGQYALTNMDNPNDIAQELSNLQSLRRMSMDVGNMKDPDMPPMSLSSMPVIAPSGTDDENDPSRLLWVPASVHPELAPSEFQSFLETRVNSIRRRSRDSLSPESGLSRSNSGRSLGSGGSLKRQKSMLSRQVDSADSSGSDYVDGAERLEQQRSRQGGGHGRELSLDELVKDPTQAVKKLAQESQGGADGTDSSPDDVPILPMAPGMGLRRSTRTTYRKGGSLRSGDRALSRRLRGNNNMQESESSSADVPPVPNAPPGHGLVRVQSEPITDSFSKPSSSLRRPQPTIQESAEALAALEGSPTSPTSPQQSLGRSKELPMRPAAQPSQDASEPTLEDSAEPIIAEPPPKSSRRQQPQQQQQQLQQQQQQQQLQSQQPQQPKPSPPQQYTSKQQPAAQYNNLDEQIAGGSAASGVGGYGTDNLTVIPTMTEDKKSDKKSRKDKDDDASSTKSSGSSAWKWFKTSNDEKEKKKEEKRSRAKALVEKAQDNVRLDVIQTSIDKSSQPAPKGRESFILDRDAVDSRLQEERKKETNRRSDSKKEKDGNIFTSIFGGSKKKDDKDRHSKKSQHLRVPSEPAIVKPLEPNVDYHWTRFPLLEERAIYRMAHIKLANPRRPLHSQVLLSNFMYSYLAIVQAMHPNMNVPVSPQQKRLEEEARRKREEEEYLAQQQMYEGHDDQGLDQYDFEYHRAAAQYADPANDGSVDYVDDAQIYEDEHGTDHHHHQQQHAQQHHHQHYQEYDYDPHDGYSDKDYYQQQQQHQQQHHHDGRHGGDMW